MIASKYYETNQLSPLKLTKSLIYNNIKNKNLNLALIGFLHKLCPARKHMQPHEINITTHNLKPSKPTLDPFKTFSDFLCHPHCC